MVIRVPTPYPAKSMQRSARSAPASVTARRVILLSKLRMRDRAQLVVLAYESGLVRPGGGGQESCPRSITRST